MQKSLSSKSAGPKSEFASLVEEVMPEVAGRNPSPLDWFALIWPPRLKPNCLLTRLPVFTLLPSQGNIAHSFQMRWLTWQAQRHGYAIQVISPEELSLLKDGTYHLLRSETVLPQLSWSSPLTALDQFLEQLNSLAEADFRRNT